MRTACRRINITYYVYGSMKNDYYEFLKDLFMFIVHDSINLRLIQ